MTWYMPTSPADRKFLECMLMPYSGIIQQIWVNAKLAPETVLGTGVAKVRSTDGVPELIE